jgi:hypothetical protein
LTKKNSADLKMPHFRPSQEQLWELSAALLVAHSKADPMISYNADVMGNRASMALEQALALNAHWSEMAAEIDDGEKAIKNQLGNLFN